MNPLLTQALGSIVRFFLAMLAGFLVKYGIWDQANSDRYVEAGAAAIVLALGTVGWSLWVKYRERIKLVTALAAPAPMTEKQVENQIASGVSAPASTPKTEVPEVVNKHLP